MKHERKHGEALQDSVRTHGAPIAIKTDCAQSELGIKWTETCQNNCIAQETTKPHNPQQNPTKKRISDLGSMVKRCMRAFNILIKKHDWVDKWCANSHIHISSCNHDLRNPLEVSTGHTPDISAF